jgi:hypothetical protein
MRSDVQSTKRRVEGQVEKAPVLQSALRCRKPMGGRPGREERGCDVSSSITPDDEAPPHEVYESCLHQMWQDETDEATADAIAKARAAAHKQEVNQ